MAYRKWLIIGSYGFPMLPSTLHRLLNTSMSNASTNLIWVDTTFSWCERHSAKTGPHSAMPATIIKLTWRWDFFCCTTLDLRKGWMRPETVVCWRSFLPKMDRSPFHFLFWWDGEDSDWEEQLDDVTTAVTVCWVILTIPGWWLLFLHIPLFAYATKRWSRL